MTTYYSFVQSPVKGLLLLSDGSALTAIHFLESGRHPGIDKSWIQHHDATPFEDARRQLRAYFAGTLREFDLPIALEGTPFQKRVWTELQEIPFGETISYGELASRIGNPSASRAVGLANGKNPVSIVVPCHRVIGSNGTLTGYGGGLPVKQALLRFEAEVCGGGTRQFALFQEPVTSRSRV